MSFRRTATVERMTPPGRYVVLYDGACRFCAAGMRQLVAWARRGVVQPVDFQQPAALDPFPGLTHDACMRQMHLVTPSGKVYGGFEAAVRAVMTRPILGWLARLYYLPGLRQLLDALYSWIARRRYRLLSRQVAAGECPDGTCALHAAGAMGLEQAKAHGWHSVGKPPAPTDCQPWA